MDERFEGYIQELLAGKRVTIAADDRYGDFIRYVENSGDEVHSKFKKYYQREFKDVDDEAITVVVEMWLELPKAS
ncbi:hypothetical protein QTG56_25365 (plasmid) [Rossellomorea sp. AcN35-11]|nr:hypothetical protein [Rossellomorea aquimaris]WJV31946.1 hypothetical protein QTG56_25365 [Rossellomorea sp. AcN35-11]